MDRSQVDEFIKHYGVKGMRWGVRKDKGKITIRDRLNSMKRERQWKKVLGEIDNLSNDQMTNIAKRVGLENELKRLSKKSPAAGKKDKLDYVKRGEMDNDELSRKVTRLRAKDQLTRQINDASKEQMEFGRKVVNVSGSLAMKYANQKALTPKDLFESLNDANKPIKDKVVKDIVDSVNKKSSK